MSLASQPLQVAVGVVRDAAGNILLTERGKHAHQGGLWEFPGGKLEPGESTRQALTRELWEEVGIQVQAALPLIKINYQYPDRHVLLDVWEVRQFQGTARPCEGQAMRWVPPKQLDEYDFPAANRPIISAARLPDHYAILEGNSSTEVLQRLECILKNSVSLLQLRIKSLPLADLVEVQQTVLAHCQASGVTVLVNADLPVIKPGFAGLHLSSQKLMACRQRPNGYLWVAASCHSLSELRQAEKIGADFAVLAPVMPTNTHPTAKPLGFEQLANLISQVNIPVFALGGLLRADLERVRLAGAQGIAGISAFSSPE